MRVHLFTLRYLVICLLWVIVSPLFFSSTASALENIFTSSEEIGSGARRLGNEALEIASTPLDTEHYGLLGTILVTGAVALTSSYDEDIRTKVQGIKGKNLDRATDAGSILGDPFLHLGLSAVVYGSAVLADSPKYKEMGEMLGEAAMLADVTTLLLKESIGRGRPATGSGSGSFHPFQFKSDYDSLPSMHTASSFAIASVIASTTESNLVRLGAYTAATFVGFSRLYQDKHWASDIVLGAAIGELCGRVVTGYHASGKERRIAVAPVITDTSALLTFVGRF